MPFKQIKYVTFILLTLFFSQLSSVLEALPPVEIIDLSETPNTRSLNPRENQVLRDHLGTLIDSLNGPPFLSQKLLVSPKEAKHYFYDYLVEKLGQPKADSVASRFFTEDYFGIPMQFRDEIPVWMEHLELMLAAPSSHQKEILNRIYKKCSPRDLFLRPRDAIEDLSEHPLYGQKYQKEIEKFREGTLPSDHLFYHFFSSTYFKGEIPSNSERRRQFFLSQSYGFLDHNLIQNLYLGAQKILHVSQKGDSLIFIGNTVYLLGRAVQMILQSSEPDDLRNIIFFPFSGKPTLKDSRNCITPERLDHLRTRLRQAGLTPENKNLKSLHFVDVIYTGSGISFLIEEILRSFKEAQLEMPHCHVCAINEFNIENPHDDRHSFIAERSSKDGGTQLLSFPSKKNLHFRVPATVTHVPSHTLLDHNETSEWRFVPSFPPSLWAKNFDHLLTSPLTYDKQLLIEYFDTHVRDIIDSQNEKYNNPENDDKKNILNKIDYSDILPSFHLLLRRI
ncbi:MAG: hypothetical protein B7Y25_01455 [Alphaproteobacteria bacterium 16-39-46]|nr:MAG: hypothetical protein B7Y25_01455 [Alphaproteobacteria bacterium 16-39-46]OZA44082.1 MAG: hypothetical protein B7X84_01440 [Alphaproteobacteria bacterium 17-39-52]HQS83598.1 hypothetical protein [Alphaproteobacteria bacterium]HQS93387.1 hypothetical protein [Alphaproteobacteria bacterium]